MAMITDDFCIESLDSRYYRVDPEIKGPDVVQLKTIIEKIKDQEKWGRISSLRCTTCCRIGNCYWRRCYDAFMRMSWISWKEAEISNNSTDIRVRHWPKRDTGHITCKNDNDLPVNYIWIFRWWSLKARKNTKEQRITDYFSYCVFEANNLILVTKKDRTSKEGNREERMRELNDSQEEKFFLELLQTLSCADHS
jgi:hypothetical protein